MLYIFDLDGTLRVTKSGRPCPNYYNDQIILPGVYNKLQQLNSAYHILAVASNQNGVAAGYMTPDMAVSLAHETEQLLGIKFSAMEFSFFNDRSKPNPTMAMKLLDQFRTGECVIIGNQYSDFEFAINTNSMSFSRAKFVYAHDFFGWGDNYVARNYCGYFPREWLCRWQLRKRIKA